MSDTLPPRYETLELVVPESATAREHRIEEERRQVIRVISLAVQTVAWFLIGVLIGYTLATPRAAQEGRPAGGISSLTPELLGAPRSWVAQRQSTGGRMSDVPEVAGSNPALGSRGAPLPAVAQAIPLTGSVLALSGYATWYDVAPGNAAAGPAVRAWLGSGWRGTAVKVCHGGGCVLTQITDFCACSDRNGRPTLVDLSRTDFAVIAPPSSGVTTVTVSRAGAIALPATDTK